MDGDVLFFSSPQAGARGLRIVATPDGFETQQVWATRRIQFYHAATVQDGQWVYGSTGLDQNPVDLPLGPVDVVGGALEASLLGCLVLERAAAPPGSTEG